MVVMILRRSAVTEKKILLSVWSIIAYAFAFPCEWQPQWDFLPRSLLFYSYITTCVRERGPRLRVKPGTSTRDKYYLPYL